MTLTLEIDRETLDYLEEQARERDLPDASAAAEAALRGLRAQDRPMTRGERAVARLRAAKTNGITADELMQMTRDDGAPPTDRGARAIERLRGTADAGLTTDEIMQMTRGE